MKLAPRAAILLLLASCKDTPSAPIFPSRAAGVASTAAGYNCGAAFRMITSEQDSLMAPYGIGFTSDTVDVCESWTGSDYTYTATGAGSSDNVPGFASEVQSAEYQSGYITGYASDGSAATQPVSAGGTSFDFLYADDATRQASYDYPYYGVSSPDPSACIVPDAFAERAGASADP